MRVRRLCGFLASRCPIRRAHERRTFASPTICGLWSSIVLFVAPVRSWLLTQQSFMPLTPSQLEELQQEYFAEDVPFLPEMASWTEDAARAYFDSGGATKPGAAVALSGLFALPPSKLINGSNLDMSSLAPMLGAELHQMLVILVADARSCSVRTAPCVA